MANDSELVVGAPAAAARASVALRRIPLSVDPLNPAAAVPAAVVEATRVAAATKFHLALGATKTTLGQLASAMHPQTLPERLIGVLVQPAAKRPAARVQVSLDLKSLGLPAGAAAALTDDQGGFTLRLPKGRRIPTDVRALTLQVHGANQNVALSIPLGSVSFNGIVPMLVSPAALDPLPVSIIASLGELLDGAAPVPPPAPIPPATTPAVTLGEGACQLSYQTNAAVDRFPYGVFFRLVEPQTSVVSEALMIKQTNGGKVPVPLFAPATDVDFVDRVPVTQPISVDGFRDSIVGVGSGTTVGVAESVPMAGTLGLGYVVRMAQLWTPRGLALGDLVYSLPLAPGEQQRIAIFERRDTTSVLESEALSIAERDDFSERDDTSTLATFQSAFRELESGGSHFDTDSDSSGHGWNAIVFASGSGSSSSNSNASTWLDGQRDTVESTTESSHAAVQRAAAARRDSARTAMRIASANEAENVTTKTITNHNHTRALTLQYWEVHRLYEVASAIEGVTLTCLVPLEVVRFLPAGQPLALTAPPATRAAVLDRYAQILKHADIIDRGLPGEYRNGLRLLRRFAADPTATVQSTGTLAEDVIAFDVTGTFLPFEEVYVAAVTRQGTRVGRARLAGPVAPIPSLHDLANLPHAFTSEEALIGYLRDRRSLGSSGTDHVTTLHGTLAIPPTFARNDIVGFELSRAFDTFAYELIDDEAFAHSILGFPFADGHVKLVKATVTLAPSKLEALIGGPMLTQFTAAIVGAGAGGVYADGVASSPVEEPPLPMPIPATLVPPELRYAQLLEVERATQYVVRNTIPFSKLVWQSLTPEERAILLEGYTIGVPPGGITDATQDVPLLNCIENRVLGYYGNSMIMPFIIPAVVADALGFTSADVQDTLTAFHKAAFHPPTSTTALPTHGVLGEAVLGHCSSAERIDLTRFWNWSDAPGDTAPTIADVTVPTTTPSLVAGATAPATLGGIAPLINNFSTTGVTPNDALVQALAAAAAAQKDLPDATGASLLANLIPNTITAASTARSDALAATKQLTAQAIATAANLYGGKDNSTAGTAAAQAVYQATPAPTDTKAVSDALTAEAAVLKSSSDQVTASLKNLQDANTKAIADAQTAATALKDANDKAEAAAKAAQAQIDALKEQLKKAGIDPDAPTTQPSTGGTTP